MKRNLRAAIMLFVAVSISAILGWWLYFRYTHVVASYAFVKGSVVQVGAPIQGQIASVEARPGQRVNQGDVLIRFNDIRQRALVAQARAALEQSIVQVHVEGEAVKVLHQKAWVVTRELIAKKAVSEAEAREADVDARLAAKQAERSKSLRERDMVSQSEHDVVVAMNDVAKEKMTRARDKVDLSNAQAQIGGVEEAHAKAKEARLELLEAAVNTARAALEGAAAELDLTVVRAAKTGTISRRLVEPGAAVRVGGPMLEIWYDDDLGIEAWIDESKYGLLAVGAPAETTLPGLGQATFRVMSSRSASLRSSS